MLCPTMKRPLPPNGLSPLSQKLIPKSRNISGRLSKSYIPGLSPKWKKPVLCWKNGKNTGCVAIRRRDMLCWGRYIFRWENMKKHWNLYAFPIDFYRETPMYIWPIIKISRHLSVTRKWEWWRLCLLFRLSIPTMKRYTANSIPQCGIIICLITIWPRQIIWSRRFMFYSAKKIYVVIWSVRKTL